MKTTNGALATLGAGTALTAAAVLDGLVVAAVIGFKAWPGAGAS